MQSDLWSSLSIKEIFSLQNNIAKLLFLRLPGKFHLTLPNDKILDVTKLKALADNKLSVIQSFEFALDG